MGRIDVELPAYPFAGVRRALELLTIDEPMYDFEAESAYVGWCSQFKWFPASCGCPPAHSHSPIGCLVAGCNCKATQ